MSRFYLWNLPGSPGGSYISSPNTYPSYLCLSLCVVLIGKLVYVFQIHFVIPRLVFQVIGSFIPLYILRKWEFGCVCLFPFILVVEYSKILVPL